MEPCSTEHSPGQVHGVQGHTETQRPVRLLHQVHPLSRTAALQAGFQVGMNFGLRFCSAAITLGCSYSDEMPLDWLPHPPVRLPSLQGLPVGLVEPPTGSPTLLGSTVGTKETQATSAAVLPTPLLLSTPTWGGI